MSDDWDDNNNDGNQGGGNSGGGGLRAQLESALAKLRVAEESRAKLEGEVRQTKIKDLVSAKGFNPKVAAVVPDKVEATDEKIGAWLDENADWLPKAATSGAQTQTGSTQTEDTDADEAETVDRMGSALAQGMPPEKVRDLERRIEDVKSVEDMDKLMQQSKHIRFR
jgi:hypothetical protein